MRSIVLMLLCFASLNIAQSLPKGVTLDTSDWIPFPLSAYEEMQGTALDTSGLLGDAAGLR